MGTRLTISGAKVSGVYGLLGADENAATFALGWTMANSRHLLKAVLDAIGLAAPSENALIDLQRHRSEDGGFSDIEIRVPGKMHVILEAKRGWNPPSVAQLARYARRTTESADRRLVSLTGADHAYAAPLLPQDVGGVPVVHLSWTQVRRLTEATLQTTSSWGERLWLTQLSKHLEAYVSEQTTNSNIVYVVSLSRQTLEPDYTWIDVVERDRSYFHPYGAGTSWPVTPPNYLGFRYDGRLQNIRHVTRYIIAPNLGDVNAKWEAIQGTHIVYELGPPMTPVKEIRTGNIFRAARVYCAIDTLLSGECDTISAAQRETARRLEQAN